MGGIDGAHILLIEDDPDVLGLVQQLLVESGFHVVAADTGERGLKFFDPLQIDLVILDAMLPGLSGWEVCQRLKSQPVRPYVPIMMLTARAALHDRVRGLEAGADDYLTKPFDIDEFLAHVRAMLRIRSAEYRLWEHAQDLELLNAVATSVNGSLNVSETASLALTRLASATSASIGGIWLADDGGSAFRLVASVGLLTPATRDIIHLQRPHVIASRVLAEEEPLRLVAERDASLFGPHLPPDGAVVYLPLASKGTPIGMLALGSERPDAFPPAMLRLLATLSVTIAVAFDNARLYAQTRQVADTDGVTGIYNHRYMQEVIESEISRSMRSGQSFAILMIDLDRFKSYNDSFGHPAGDLLLHDLSRMLTGACRRTDSVGRYGGDEFIIMLPETSRQQAEVLAERIQSAYADLATDRDYDHVGVSLSIGIAIYPEDGHSRKELITAADRAMYRAKNQGGGQVVSMLSES
jgi:two-component system cell cycle response regulator